ncbi:MAG: hypothetical protein AB2L17_15585 [Lentimicrobium sp.]
MKTVDIFWTGGFDSTFRVLQLLNQSDCYVQPHYIILEDKSTWVEIGTMIRIRKVINNRFFNIAHRLLPTMYINHELIKKDPEIETEISRLRQELKVIEQYHLMANYCKELNICNIEVAIIHMEGEMGLFKQHRSIDIFKAFSFPISELSKKMIYDISLKEGWDDILMMTSFCKRPIIKVEPCGLCSPCTTAVAEGLDFRLPLKSRLIAKLQIPFRKYIRKRYRKLKDNKIIIAIQKKLYE